MFRSSYAHAHKEWMLDSRRLLPVLLWAGCASERERCYGDGTSGTRSFNVQLLCGQIQQLPPNADVERRNSALWPSVRRPCSTTGVAAKRAAAAGLSSGTAALGEGVPISYIYAARKRRASVGTRPKNVALFYCIRRKPADSCGRQCGALRAHLAAVERQSRCGRSRQQMRHPLRPARTP